MKPASLLLLRPFVMFVCALLLSSILASAQLPNAWQINDNSTTGSSTLAYFTNLTAAQFDAATTNGWRFTITSRLVTDYGGAAGSMYFIYGDGTHRYGINLHLNAGGQLVITPLGGSAITVTTAAGAGTNYHRHELEFDAASGNVTYRFDGTSTATWAGQVSTGQSHEAVWGSVSSADRGEMNFNHVDFEVFGAGVVATYDAGFAGNPAVAPDPQTQGWALSGSTGLVTVGPVSPDSVPWSLTLPLVSGIRDGSMAWGDYDNDGLLDLLVIGSTNNSSLGKVCQIWRNAGTGFTNIGVNLTGTTEGAAAWGDYDNDGRLDVLLAGSDLSGVRRTEIWRNTGSGFVNINAGLTGVYRAAVAWGDYDNDGRLDVLLSGADATSTIRTEIWRNTGSGFTNINAGLPGLQLGAVAWGDYDNDGRLDVLLSGSGLSGVRRTEIWRNTGSGFVNINAGLPGLTGSSVAWADFDNDGRLDVLLAGTDPSSVVRTEVWRNTGSGFVNANAGLTAVSSGAVAWGDYDNDGRPDVLLTGFDSSIALRTEFWRNTTSGFTNFPTTLPGVYSAKIAWGDYDRDGRLDAAVAGFALNNVAIGLAWVNVTPITNTAPLPPSNLSLVATNPTAILTWSPGGDAETPVEGLSYNIRIGTVPGASDVVNPQADASGLRLVPALGNAGMRTNFMINLLGGTYYWSVQAIDSAWAGSAFAAEASFTVPSLPVVTTLAADEFFISGAQLNGDVNPDNLETSWWFEYGVTTNYGSFTTTNVLAAGIASVAVSNSTTALTPDTIYHYRIVASNAAGLVKGDDQSFTFPGVLEIARDLPGVTLSTAAWADFDRDGRLDLLVSGLTDSNQNYAAVWRNIGNGFTNINLPLPGVSAGKAAWGDFDNDGWPDFVLTGIAGTNFFTQIWRNTGGNFTSINAALTPVGYGAAAWGDYDNDGRLDLLLSGQTNYFSAETVTELWRNTGTGFVRVDAGLPGLFNSVVAWGDYDNDGHLDLALAGTSDLGTYAAIWRNTGNGFTNINAGLPAVSSASLTWGDYDNDGRLDLLLAGQPSGVFSPAITGLWRNSGIGFTNANAALPGMASGEATFGDYDNDGWRDIALSGASRQLGGSPLTRILRNVGGDFTNNIAILPELMTGTGAWGDANQDGRLDLLLTGSDINLVSFSSIWFNPAPATNSPPTAPAGLNEAFVNGQVQLSWMAASDAETPATSLSYNVRIGTAPGDGDIVSPDSETNGFRLMPALGNAQLRTNGIFNLAPGTYYWSVQAVDGAYAGGPFASEASFVVSSSEPVLSIAPTNANVVISWQPSVPGWVLQENPILSPAGWNDSASGATNPVTVPATNAMRFYRLFKP